MERFKEKKDLYVKYVSILIVCVLCFGMGFSVSRIMTQSNETDEWKKLKTIYSILTERWYYANQIEDLDSTLIENAINGMSYLEEDLHTNYFSLEMAQKFSSSLEGSSVGIGFGYYENADNNLVINNVYVNSPADLAGLKKGDIITCVENLDCASNAVSEIVSLIKSSEGKELKIQFIRDGKEETTTIKPTSYDATVCCEIEKDYAIIRLTSFSEYSAKEFNESVQRIRNAGITNLIIDLRNNSGGYLKSVLDISSCLIPDNATVFIENNADGSQTVQTSSNKYETVDFDSIVILQNDNTASASEVLIGTLKDNLGDKVKTVGTQSYGKGTEQVSVAFSDGTSLKYTVCEWVTPNETSINLVGFTPDYKVELGDVQTVKYAEMADDELIEADHVHTNAAALQTFLKFLGYEVDRTDEYFSETSSKSLAQFQKDYGIRSNGICDSITWKKIKEVVLLEINEHNDELDYQLLKAIELSK